MVQAYYQIPIAVVIRHFIIYRDWFLTNDKRWAVNESLRPSGNRDDRVDKVKELPGSFRSLALD